MSLVGREQKKGGKPFRQPYPDKPAADMKEPEIKNPALQTIISEQEHTLKSGTEASDNKPESEKRTSPPPGEAVPLEEITEAATPERGTKITAIVLELINEELETVVNRFKIEPNDSNLWKLTRAALEAIRPEYSHSPEEYTEKCGRLRQKVILEMTKTAIRLSKGKRTEE